MWFHTTLPISFYFNCQKTSPRANKLSLTGLFWVIGCKMTHFQLPAWLRWGKASTFLKRWRYRPWDEGWRCEARRQIVARHRRFPSGTFINYSNLFSLSVSNTGQPSAAIVFLKAFFYWHTLTKLSVQISTYIIIYVCFVCSFIDKREINTYGRMSFLTSHLKAAHIMLWML